MQYTSLKSFVLTLSFLCFINPFASASIIVPTNVYFGLPTYGTYIHFSTEQTLTEIYRENDYWYFDGYGFQVENANVTITNFGFTDDLLEFTVSAPSGTSTTRIFCNNMGEPTSVSRASSYSYNRGTQILTVNVAHSSNVNVIVSWVPRTPESIFRDVWVAVSLLSLLPFVLGGCFVYGMLMIHKKREEKELETIDYVGAIGLVVIVIVLIFLTVLLINAFTGVM